MPQNWDLCCNYPKNVSDAETIIQTAIHLGYDGIAWNVTVPAKAIVPCAIKCVDIESIAKEIAKDRFVKLPQYSLFRLQREAKVFQQKTRITVIVDDMKDIECLSSKKSALASYDLIAVLPKNDKMFQYVCLHAEVDIISYKLDEDLTFRFKMSTVGSASSRRVVHEICYAPLIRDPSCRRRFVGNVLALVKASRGKSLITSSGIDSAIDLRSAHDMQNVMLLYGLSVPESVSSISCEPCSVIIHAESRRIHKTAAQATRTTTTTTTTK